jgi:hypothetical protein
VRYYTIKQQQLGRNADVFVSPTSMGKKAATSASVPKKNGGASHPGIEKSLKPFQKKSLKTGRGFR